ncbi:helix-turn-helix domain-containing protein [Ornithinimicrobium sp. F0845]|uniref:helix-turn-helix domain-containing protein n=1 Tax=Ornithinimicrobium sp. F0845 TaxID=2926412 RepID=UPI001FF1593F|nr:helix-turn-helix domain-containing protein [Ornithinimicrobium sp. F0845]MCK0110777.1 helix-turn-helix domain-containing protein [Ornithinimicrobium sp. F0845]
MSRLPVPDLGSYLREQRESAQMSVRQVAKAAGISNPYLSQIERGLRRPSAEILQQLAKGLRISAEQLYIRAGILDDSSTGAPVEQPYDVTVAIMADERLTDRQRRALLDVYRSFVGDGADATAEPVDPATPDHP